MSRFHAVGMRAQTPFPVDEARASVLAWARSKGLAVREERGWIILEVSDQNPDPMLKLVSEVLKGSA